MQTFYYPSADGKLCVTPSFTISRRKLKQAMGKSYPVLHTMTHNEIAKFKPKFKRA